MARRANMSHGTTVVVKALRGTEYNAVLPNGLACRVLCAVVRGHTARDSAVSAEASARPEVQAVLAASLGTTPVCDRTGRRGRRVARLTSLD